jgi:dolichyl-phosphate beta-glucosyltransferase
MGRLHRPVALGTLLVGLSLRLRTAVRRRAFQIRTHQGQPVAREPAPGEYRMSIVIPAYRESDRIVNTVAEVRAALSDVDSAGAFEIIVVDDGSLDDTALRAREAKADQVLVHPVNRGKGAAVRSGVMAARGRTVAFTDADLSYPPGQLVRLLTEVEAGYDVVVGSRKHIEATTLVRGRRLRELSGRVFNLLTLAVLLGQYRDTQCGIKAFRSDAARTLFARARIDGFAFDVELFHLVERDRLTLKEVPVALANAETSTVRVGIDAIRMLRDLFRIRWWGSRGIYDPIGSEGDAIRAEGTAPGRPSTPS